VTKFTDLGLAEPVLRAVIDEGYETPTPIQAQAIPSLLAGNDIVGIAQTGTGKTAAFVLPSLCKIAKMGGSPTPRTARVLILAPTRELAAQIHESVIAYGKNLQLSTAVVVGGVKPGKQIRAMNKGLDVLVATPGRLLDHMSTGALSLRETNTVILDEADQMLDMGFIPAIRKVMAAVPDKRQTMLLSATMPKQIRSLADDFLRSPKEIAVTPVSKPIDLIDQSVILVEKEDKLDELVHYLSGREVESAIVFSRTKHGADKITRVLEKNRIPAAAIHGNKSQNQRIRALQAFKDGKVLAMVATDIAARGIDIDGVSHVVNFDLPNIPESYVHRIGRTARAGKSGVAVSYCSGEERLMLVEIEKLIGFQIDKYEVDDEGEAHAVPKMEITAEHRAAAKEAAKKQGGGGGGRRGGGGGRGRGKPGGGAKAQGGGGRGRSGGGGNRGRGGKPKGGGKGSGNSGGQRNKSGSGTTWSPS